MSCVHVCGEEERELGRREAAGSCQYCGGGKVEAVDVKIKCRICFLPLGFVVKRRYICTDCGKHLTLCS
ncbi:hypothetical protein F511_09597 [Dorcoceras hygrometricum]|uniref:Uncharacterized protein n=1 Tax=Dorcoceras hygrometricum TaxID=472368 RepID=A0A2Z7CPJ1_9LAMI|nr:hypothetical protein F511_09597 [Dorcoceras hygrometricum]